MLQNCQTNWFAKAMQKPLKKGVASTNYRSVSLCTGALWHERSTWWPKVKSLSGSVGGWFEDIPQKGCF